MAVLGTKKFWKPSDGSSNNQRDNQILKNSGYINLQLRTVNYMSKGNFWQKTFGGKDNIALATTLKYQSGVDSIEATSVQDVRKVVVDKNYNLGLQRNCAVKIPANSDAIAIEVKMTAVKNDMLQAKFDMLNQTDYQSALQLAPTVVGQVITITSLVKKLFTDSDANAQLEASYAGIISAQKEDSPVSNGKLTKGLLIMISTNEGEQFNSVDESKFELRGDSLYYDRKQVENTYLIFNVSFDQFKGEDEKSNWFRKYNDALNNLDKIQLTQDQNEISKIYSDTKTMWIEGNALIDADISYISKERIQIKNAAIASIQDKYKSLTTINPISILSATEILKGVTGSSSFSSFEMALPKTSAHLTANHKIDLKNLFSDLSIDAVDGDKDIDELLKEDNGAYLDCLRSSNLSLKLGRKE